MSLPERIPYSGPSMHIPGLCLGERTAVGYFPAVLECPRVSDLPLLAMEMPKASHIPGRQLYAGAEGVYPMSSVSVILSAVSTYRLLLRRRSKTKEGMAQSFPCLVSLGLF